MKVCSSDLSLPESLDDRNRRIAGGPVYDLHDVRELLRRLGGQCIHPWSRKCVRDIQELSFDNNDIAKLLNDGLQNATYRGSEWCQGSNRLAVAACDSYRIYRSEWNEKTGDYLELEYYVKFAIGRTGGMLILASCHLS